MFAGSAFSTAPFSATAGGVVFDAAVLEAATVTDLEYASSADFAVVQADTVVGSDVAAVIASIFSAAAQDTAQGTDTTATSSDFAVSVTDTAATADSTAVAASIFNAPVSETVTAADTVLALAVFFATMTDGAVGVDQIAARLLWEIINDSQNANWTQVNNAQPTSWSIVKTQS